MKNEKTINLDVAFTDFARQGKDDVIASVVGNTPGGKRIKVKLRFHFYCLPWTIGKLSREWKFARERRLAEIALVDRVLP